MSIHQIDLTTEELQAVIRLLERGRDDLHCYLADSSPLLDGYGAEEIKDLKTLLKSSAGIIARFEERLS